MLTRRLPAVGRWFEDIDGRSLHVVAVDEEEDTIEIQYFDSEIAEFSVDDWTELNLTPIEAPEDWTGPFDDLELDDLGDTEKPMHPVDWDGPWNEIEGEE